LGNLLDLLLPREAEFFDHMSGQAENLCDGCKEFKIFVSDIGNAGEDEIHDKVKLIKDIELKGDDIERAIIRHLDETFITPLDREDIHDIVTGVDKSLDLLNDTAQKMEIYSIRDVPPNIVKFCGIIEDASLELRRLIASLDGMDGTDIIVRKIHTLENEADFLYHTSMAELFLGADPIRIVKFKDIYTNLEELVNSMDHIAKTVRGVAVKQG
jgi:uncharacterized protein